jgi:ATPase subunit of ABC transporter with duplicated ATPase domains
MKASYNNLLASIVAFVRRCVVMHSPIQISYLSLICGHKLCFNNFSYTIYSGAKIAIIGNNGSGKSSLLKLIFGINSNSIDGVTISKNLIFGYVPQIIADFAELSGGQRFNKALSLAIADSPNLLLLDEPTNHLDSDNRKSLVRFLKNYSATQIIISHDIELLDNCIDTIWHIHDGQISVFNGKYSAYLVQLQSNKQKLLTDIAQLKHAQRQQHEALMKEQQRTKKKKTYGEKKYDGDKLALRSAEELGQTTAAKNALYLNQTREALSRQLNQLWKPEEISYSFNLSASAADKAIVTINQGSCGYLDNQPILQQINLNLFGNNRIAISGANGSGKSTLVKAIMGNQSIWRSGEWLVPNLQNIAYLDQHYSNLPCEQTILEYLKTIAPSLSSNELRNFLNQFLFRKNEEINNRIGVLSGGEKARLSLAAIALVKPKLLIMDEITNNVDLITRKYVIHVLQTYPGAMLIISHDTTFLGEIQINERYNVT